MPEMLTISENKKGTEQFSQILCLSLIFRHSPWLNKNNRCQIKDIKNIYACNSYTFPQQLHL